MRSKQQAQPNRNSSQSTFTFLRNVLVEMVFFEPIPSEKPHQQIQRSEKLHAEAMCSHARSQAVISKSDEWISEFSRKY
jgi:hypothetical protein